MVVRAETKKLTIRLPQDDLQFIKQFAHERNVTVTELVKRYFSHLRQQTDFDIDPSLQKITGVLPESLDVREEYQSYLMDKHQ